MKELERIGYKYEEIAKYRVGTDTFKDFCYQVVTNYENDPKTISKIAALFGMYKDEFKAYARDLREERKMRLYQNKKNINIDNYKKTGTFVEELIRTKTKEEVIDLLTSDRYKNFQIDYYIISAYIVEKYSDSVKDIKERIAKRLNCYNSYLKGKTIAEKTTTVDKKEQEFSEGDLREARKWFDFILNHEEILKLEDFRLHKYVSFNTYDKYAKIWHKEKINDNFMFDILQNEFKKRKQKHLEDNYGEIVSKFLSLISNGVTVGDRIRNIDILDCITYFRKNFGDILEYLRHVYTPNDNLSDEKKKYLTEAAFLKNVLVNFYNKIPKLDESKDQTNIVFSELEKQAIANILELKINLSGKENEFLSFEDKQNIINGLKDENIPITSSLFWLAVNKYHNGKLELITKDTIDNYLEKGKSK